MRVDDSRMPFGAQHKMPSHLQKPRGLCVRAGDVMDKGGAEGQFVGIDMKGERVCLGAGSHRDEDRRVYEDTPAKSPRSPPSDSQTMSRDMRQLPFAVAGGSGCMFIVRRATENWQGILKC